MNVITTRRSMTDFFPFPSYRQFQKETVQKVNDCITNNVRDIIVEMPTGSGKSPVAIGAGLWSRQSYCLTSQKILQDQYVKDFEDKFDVAVLKGRGNYECTFMGDPTMCNECYTDARKQCYRNGTCLYQNAKLRAINSKVALMNYSYFLNVIECDPSGKFGPRELMICDEAHQIEDELMGQIEFLLSEYMFKRVGYPIKVPTYEHLSQYEAWMKENIGNILALLRTKTKTIKDINRERMDHDRESMDYEKLGTEAKEQTSQMEELDRLYRRMKVFLDTLNDVEWVFTEEKTKKLKMKRIVFKPLTVDRFAEESLLQYGQHRLYMSATILDKNSFCKSLGLDPTEAEFIQVDSTFPVANRKAYFTKTGYMNMANIDNTLPNIVTDLNKALNHHKTEKGLIHCHSYKIANFIEENCIDPRLIFHNSENRESILSVFMETDAPLVLVSPSMTEGLDLKDDLARWEVIVKIPYLYLGDQQVARRMKIDPEWYIWQTCLTLVQSYGRIFRSETDWGSAYIFDSGARGFIWKHRKILPKWFLEACNLYR